MTGSQELQFLTESGHQPSSTHLAYAQPSFLIQNTTRFCIEMEAWELAVIFTSYLESKGQDQDQDIKSNARRAERGNLTSRENPWLANTMSLQGQGAGTWRKPSWWAWPRSTCWASAWVLEPTTGLGFLFHHLLAGWPLANLSVPQSSRLHNWNSNSFSSSRDYHGA